MSDEHRRYLSYLLRLWQTEREGVLVWCASLESPTTGERQGFVGLDALCSFLRRQIGEVQTLGQEQIKSRKESEPMSVERNKTILRRFFEELFNEGNLAVAGEIVAEDYVNHDPAPGEQPGLQGLKVFITGMRTSFPDGHFGIDDQIAEGDKAVTRWTFRGTHEADFAGIPATGKQVTFSAINIHRVVDGRIQDAWLKWDTLGFMQQLGVIPMPEQTGE